MFHIKSDFNPVLSEEMIFLKRERTTDGGRRTTDHWLTVSSPCEPSAQVC